MRNRGRNMNNPTSPTCSRKKYAAILCRNKTALQFVDHHHGQGLRSSSKAQEGFLALPFEQVADWKPWLVSPHLPATLTSVPHNFLLRLYNKRSSGPYPYKIKNPTAVGCQSASMTPIPVVISLVACGNWRSGFIDRLEGIYNRAEYMLLEGTDAEERLSLGTLI